MAPLPNRNTRTMRSEARRSLVAVVDDEPIIRIAIGSLLQTAGYDAVLFASGSDFLESLTVQHPDCLLLDYSMPGLSGLDVISSLVTTGKLDIPIIIVTGSSDARLESRSLNAGARKVLRKPVSDVQLFAAVESALVERNG